MLLPSWTCCSSFARSSTTGSIPAASSAAASTRPPIPPPAIAIRRLGAGSLLPLLPGLHLPAHADDEAKRRGRRSGRHDAELLVRRDEVHHLPPLDDLLAG